MKKTLLIFLALFSMSCASESYYKNGKLVELQSIDSSKYVNDSSTKHSKSNVSIKYYKTMEGKKVGVTNQLLVKCKALVNCPTFLDTFNLSNYSKLSDTIFLVTINNRNNIFSLSKALFESTMVDFAHPNFVKERRKR